MTDLMFPAAFPKPPKKRKKPKKNYRDQADELFSKAIRGIGYCEECGSLENLQCAHVVSRSYGSIRTDFRNAVCLCRGCHMFFTLRPLEWEEWSIARLGEELYRELRLEARLGTVLDWKSEVERLRLDVPDFRAEPLERFRKRVV